MQHKRLLHVAEGCNLATVQSFGSEMKQGLGRRQWTIAVVILAIALYRVLKVFTTTRHSTLRLSDPNVLKGTDFFLNKQGLVIFRRTWKPSSAPKAVVFVVHGVGEHIGRYNEIAELLNAQGFHVVGIDHQGHGRSSGDRVHAERFMDLVEDLEQAIQISEKELPSDLPKFLFGHSMGGAIAIHTILRNPNKFVGAILSAPAVKAHPATASPTLIKIVQFLARYLPRLPISGLNANFFSREKGQVRLYEIDPIIDRSWLQAHFAKELLTGMDQVQEHMSEITLPTLVIQGSEDKITYIEGARAFYNSIKSADKKWIEYPGSYHELLFELSETRAKTHQDILDWFNAHV